MSDPLRIAWIGPLPDETGGVSQTGATLLLALADAGHDVTCFAAASPEGASPAVLAHPGIDLVQAERSWEWGRWYSRGGASLLTALTEQTTRARSQQALVGELRARHAAQPFDVIHQFSQWELLRLRRHREELPPIVLHPQVHAAGELRWHRREAHLARRCESLPRRTAVRAALVARSRLQQLDARTADRVILGGRPFADEVVRDYGVPADRVAVVPNPIDVERFTPRPPGDGADRPLELLYVSRFSVRKGVELVVDLSRRLADLEGQVVLRIVGHTSFWSDYTALLEDADLRIAVVEGKVDAPDMPAVLRRADLLVQPSHYEPFGLTVGEALASGAAVVASDCVGAVQDVRGPSCATFPTGDADAFERTVRASIDELRRDRAGIADAARAEAVRLFSPDLVAAAVADELRRATRA